MIGERLGPWVIDAEVGRGAMGMVWKAHREANGDLAAVKVLEPELAREEMFVERFQREIEALSQLHHKNIVRFFEAGEHDGTPYYAMEYVDGRDCEKIVRERGRIPWPEVLDIAEQAVAGLKHAHDAGVIHRDLKPANILLANPGDGTMTVKLADFGVAKLFARPALTAAGSFVGTAAYLSPEQATGKPATKRSDFYSFGCVLYCLISGRPPFSGVTSVDILQKHCHAIPEQLIRLAPGLPHDIDALIMRMLEKDPSKRPADGFVILRSIERIRGKVERRAKAAQEAAAASTVEEPALTVEHGEPAVGHGSATLVAGMVRRELVEQNRGGPIARFFNHPLTLLLMLAACIGLIVYGFTRKKPTAEELFAEAVPFMASDQPADWLHAWNEYLEPLQERFPGNPHSAEITAFRRAMVDWRDFERAVRSEPYSSDAERFYKLGLNAIQAGDVATAKRYWQNLTTAFQGVESDRRWIDLAERGVKRLDTLPAKKSRELDAALARAQSLWSAGKKDEAQALWTALANLYRDGPDSAANLERIERERQRGN